MKAIDGDGSRPVSVTMSAGSVVAPPSTPAQMPLPRPVSLPGPGPGPVQGRSHQRAPRIIKRTAAAGARLDHTATSVDVCTHTHFVVAIIIITVRTGEL